MRKNKQESKKIKSVNMNKKLKKYHKKVETLVDKFAKLANKLDVAIDELSTLSNEIYDDLNEVN